MSTTTKPYRVSKQRGVIGVYEVHRVDGRYLGSTSKGYGKYSGWEVHDSSHQLVGANDRYPLDFRTRAEAVDFLVSLDGAPAVQPAVL